MRYCAAYGCKNGVNTEENRRYVKESNITFHKFPLSDTPAEKTRLKAWLHKIGRKAYVPSKWSSLCSEHFTEEDFAYQPFTNMRLLKNTAVPSKFAHHKPEVCKRRKTSYEFGASVIVPEPKFKCIEVQTDITGDNFQQLIEENEALKEKCAFLELSSSELKSKLESRNKFDINEMPEDYIKRATGFQQSTISTIFNFFCLQQVLSSTQAAALTPINILFLTLIRLRQGLSANMLSLLFGVSVSTVSRNVNDCLEALYIKAKKIPIWPSKFTVNSFMPLPFKMYYPSCRVIIDCTEFFVQKPSKPELQQTSWSNYKNHNTIKSLIGIAPSGAISFISDLWFGNISDKELTLKCGILDKLEEGDLVLADRGFTILEKEFEKKGLRLETPFFLCNKEQFPLSERSENKKVSHHRVHVERAIGRIKNFQILNGIIPASLKSINKIHYVCAFLTNFCEEPLIKPQ